MLSTMFVFVALLFSPILVLGSELRNVYQIQVQNEFHASNAYLTFAHRLASHGVYHGFAHFFFDSASEEREHGKKLIDFYNVRNRELILYDIKIDDNLAGVSDLPKMVATAEQMERQVFESLINVRQAANNEKDYATVHFIEKVMLEEQTEALKFMYDLHKRIERNADNSTVLLQMMDQDLRKKQVKMNKP